jgi:hypothetical protein
MTCTDADGDDVSALAACDALDPGVLLKCPVFLLMDGLRGRRTNNCRAYLSAQSCGNYSYIGLSATVTNLLFNSLYPKRLWREQLSVAGQVRTGSRVFYGVQRGCPFGMTTYF